MSELTHQELKLLQLANNYLLHVGHLPSYRKLMNSVGYKSPRSVTLIINSLVEKGYLKRLDDNNIIKGDKCLTENLHLNFIDIPVLGNIACGNPNIAEQEIETMITVSTSIARPPHKYFIVRAQGDSMELKGINNGDLLLIRQQFTASNKDLICALIQDQCTLKEYFKSGEFIILKPHSNNPEHKPIIVNDNFSILGVLVTVLPPLI